MVTPLILIDGVQLTNAYVTYFTGPAGSNSTLTKILKMTLTNTDASNPHTFSVSIGPNGTAGKIVITARALAASESQDVPELVNLFIGAGEVLQLEADAGAQVNVHCSGVALT